MGLDHSQIADLVLLTQEKLIERGAFVDMAHDITDHIAVNQMWKSKTKQFAGGDSWDFQVQMDHNHSTKAVGLFQVDTDALTDTMVTGSVSARHVNSHYTFDLREKALQRGGVEIVDLIKTRYVGMMGSFFKVMEEFLWGKPDSSADTLTPFGIEYWIVKNATEGFNGGNPAGFTSGRAGISTGDYSRFANWTAQYTDIDKVDLVRKMRKATTKTNFHSPVVHSTPSLGGASKGIYVNYDVLGPLEEILEDQNMNLGNNLASKDGKAQFKGVSITYAPYLDDDTTDPVYMIDWRWFTIGILEGWENRLSKPKDVPSMHLVQRVDLDVSFNTVCTDPRRQIVISKSA